MSRRRRVVDSEDVDDNRSVSSGDDDNEVKVDSKTNDRKATETSDVPTMAVDPPVDSDSSAEDEKPNRGNRRKEDPASVPRTGKFFLHDDRESSNPKGGRRGGQPFERTQGKSDDMWKHDKFEELMAQDVKGKPRGDRKPKQHTDKFSKTPQGEDNKQIVHETKHQSGALNGRKRDENPKKQQENVPKREHKDTKEKKEHTKGKDSHKDSTSSTVSSHTKDAKVTKGKHNSATKKEGPAPSQSANTAAIQSIVAPTTNVSPTEDTDQKSPKSPDTPAVLNPSAREFQPSPSPPIPPSKATPVKVAVPRESHHQTPTNRKANYSPVHTQPNIILTDPSNPPYTPEPYPGVVPPMHMYPPIPPTVAPYPVYDPSMMYHLPDGGAAAMGGVAPGAMWYADPAAMYYNPPMEPVMNGRPDIRGSAHQTNQNRRKPVVSDSPLNSNSSATIQTDTTPAK